MPLRVSDDGTLGAYLAAFRSAFAVMALVCFDASLIEDPQGAMQRAQTALEAERKDGARGGTRTRTPCGLRILSPMRLPISPPARRANDTAGGFASHSEGTSIPCSGRARLCVICA